MAMTKAEKQRFDALERELTLIRAMRLTEDVPRDIPSPAPGEVEYRDLPTQGWLYLRYRLSVVRAESTTVSHRTGSVGSESREGWAKGPSALYSTKLLALKAMRREVELAHAEELARIDKMIRDETETPDAGV